jgi:hypothetical protein
MIQVRITDSGKNAMLFEKRHAFRKTTVMETQGFPNCGNKDTR